jgi:hypothetical protein
MSTLIHDPEQDLLRGASAPTTPEAGAAEAADTPLGGTSWDADYQRWRSAHLQRLDEDYAAWCQTGATRFPEDFDAWRQARHELLAEQSSAGLPLVAAPDDAPEMVKASLLFERS